MGQTTEEMQTLTTIDGEEIPFKPSTVTCVTDYDPITHAAVTWVWGIRKAPLMTKESAPRFLKRIGLVEDFARLSRPNARPVWIKRGAVSSVSKPRRGAYVEGTNSVVTIGTLTLAQLESRQVC
jgi:hypothetical protein